MHNIFATKLVLFLGEIPFFKTRNPARRPGSFEDQTRNLLFQDPPQVPNLYVWVCVGVCGCARLCVGIWGCARVCVG